MRNRGLSDASCVWVLGYTWDVNILQERLGKSEYNEKMAFRGKGWAGFPAHFCDTILGCYSDFRRTMAYGKGMVNLWRM